MKTKKSTMSSQKKKDLIFYACLLAFPLLQFFVMYVCVNFNSILLAFQHYDVVTEKYSFAFFENFERVFYLLFKSPDIGDAWKNSFLLYFINTIIGVPMGLLFSFYIYKKMFFHGVFKVLLFLPSIISVVVMGLLYKYLLNNAIPELWMKLFDKQIYGWLRGDARLALYIFFALWMSLGPNILMYVGAMSGISESLSESAQLDGCTKIQEFFYITIPCIYPTIVTFLVVGLVTVFTNQMYLYNLEPIRPDLSLYTFGYYMFRRTNLAAGNISEYTELAAMGLTFTVVIVPVTLLFRKLLVKYGPSSY